MPFVRPITYVYQTFTTVPLVSPAVPDLNCCLVGPCFHIEDYPANAADIGAGDYVKTGQTKDAPGDTDGLSLGRWDPNSTFLTISEPPNHMSGATLDASSVDVVFDDVLIDLNHGNDGAMTDNESTFTSATGDFINKKVAAGDRIVLTKAPGGAGATTVVKYVLSVTSATELKLTSTKKATEDFGNTNIRWRVEHELSDVHIDDAYVTVVGNAINIITGATGILAAYQNLTWTINYGVVYIGYRELRTDLQDVKTLNSASEITAALGAADERNALAAAAMVAFSNTNTPIQVFGVPTDDNNGHLIARDRMSTREDIYAIVPVSDSLSGSAWASGPIKTWRDHCVAFADPTKSKFRIVIGSYDTLPTEKSSAPPSDEGYTEAQGTALVDVFVDPNTLSAFVTRGVSAADHLDIARSASIQTLGTWGGGQGETIFKTAYAARALTGAMGEKRLRLAAAIAAVSAQAGDYAVRGNILYSEGGAVRARVLSGLTEGDDGTYYTITGAAGTFSNCGVNDIAALTDATTDNDGYRIRAVAGDGSMITLDLKVTGKVGLDVKVIVYRPSEANGFTVTGCSINATARKITKAAGFLQAAVGDIAIVLKGAHATETAGNVGVWIVDQTDPAGGFVRLGGSGTLVDDAGADVSVVIYHTKAARGGASITTRKRLSVLRDNSATFLTTVAPGELIEIPYPADADPNHWDTPVTSWPIDTIVSNEVLIADLDDLEELAPKNFTAGFSGDCKYRIAITLDPDAQVKELNTITASLKHMRCVMVWPNEVYVSGLANALTGNQNKQKGWYLAAAVGGMIAGLPSHQGFTYIGIGGIQQIFNSNFYFNDDQLTDLRNGGWYVFVQDSESSLPYTIHEVTTDVSAYEFGELMHVKNFDYIALYMKTICDQFKGQYNILPETTEALRASLLNGAGYLKLRKFPKIGAPVLDATIEKVEQVESDQLNVYMLVEMPDVLNKIGLYLKA